MNSASAFVAYAGHVSIDWTFTAAFTAMAVLGVFMGSAVARFVSQSQLKRAFAMFLVAVATFVLIQNAVTARTAASHLHGAARGPR